MFGLSNGEVGQSVLNHQVKIPPDVFDKPPRTKYHSKRSPAVAIPSSEVVTGTSNRISSKAYGSPFSAIASPVSAL